MLNSIIDREITMSYVVLKNAEHGFDTVKSLTSEDLTKVYFGIYPFAYNKIRSM